MFTKARSLAVLMIAGSIGLVASTASASAPPIGPLPVGPIATLSTEQNELVAVALPHRPNGRVWRIARALNANVLTEVSEADMGANVVTVFRAVGPGKTTLRFALTRGERPHAYESRTFVIRVS